jgi:hypothetical protein
MGTIPPHKADSGKQNYRKCQRRFGPKGNETHFMVKDDTFHAYQSQSSIQRRSSCMANKFANRNAVSEKLHHTFIHEFNH